MGNSRPILLFVVNIPEFFLSHRLPLALAAREAGYQVEIATGPGPASASIREMGFVHHELPLTRSGRNPFGELRFLWALQRLLRSVQPDILHLVTIKPVLYGGILSRFLRIRAVVAAISGLGTIFVSKESRHGPIRRAVLWLYRIALGHPNIKVLCQNPDDRAMVLELGSVSEQQIELIPGSGVALEDYPVTPAPDATPVVVLAARLLADKGVLEYIEAIRILRARGVQARFWLVGAPDPDNITTICIDQVYNWRDQGLIEYLGFRQDIASVFGQANIVVLPSYREGLPKVLIEAAACARAVVTTDVPGCRDAIVAGQTGVLVAVRDPVSLANGIESLIGDRDKCEQMGQAGRALAASRFSVETVIERHLTAYQSLLAQTKSSSQRPPKPRLP